MSTNTPSVPSHPAHPSYLRRGTPVCNSQGWRGLMVDVTQDEQDPFAVLRRALDEPPATPKLAPLWTHRGDRGWGLGTSTDEVLLDLSPDTLHTAGVHAAWAIRHRIDMQPFLPVSLSLPPDLRNDFARILRGEAAVSAETIQYTLTRLEAQLTLAGV